MVAGRQTTFLILLLFVCVLGYYMLRAKRGAIPFLRRIPGLDAIEEAVGRATELDRPVFFAPGRTGIEREGAAQNVAGLEVLGHVARLTARLDTKLKVGIGAASMYPAADATVRHSYVEEGKVDALRPEMIQYFSDNSWAFSAACLAMLNQDRSAAAILVGEFQAESLMIAEGAAQVGAITIAGTARNTQIPFFVAACDYTLIGDEMMAGAAYLSKDPVLIGNLASQDVGKAVGILLIVIGALSVTFGSSALVHWLER